MNDIEMETQIFARAVHGEGEIKDGGGRYDGEELTTGAVMVLLDIQKPLKNQ